MAYDEHLTPADIVYVGAGRRCCGRRSASRRASGIFISPPTGARPDRHAVVHTHSMHATVLACAHKPIPAFHYMVAVAGGTDIPCVPYATFGTQELARHVADGLAPARCLPDGQPRADRHRRHAAARARTCVTRSKSSRSSTTRCSRSAPCICCRTRTCPMMVERFKTYGQKAQDA